MNKRVLVLFPHFGIGGIPKSLCFLCNTLKQAGYDVYALSLSSNKEMLNFYQGIRRDTMGYDGSKINKQGTLKQNISKILLLFRLNKKIRQLKPAFVCTFGTDHMRIAAISLKGLSSIKLIGSERGDPNQYTEKQKEKYQRAIKRCDKFVFQTEGARDCFLKLDSGIAEVIPNPYLQLQGSVEPWDGERDKTIIACGRLSREKNFPLIVKAFFEVYKKHPEYSLKIYGSGPQKEEIYKEIKDNKLESCAHIIENCSNVFEVERKAGMFILASDFEGMPNVLMEAMGVGIPSIAVQCPPGGVDAITDKGKRALLVSMPEVKEISQAMLKYIEEPELAYQMSAKGTKVREEFSEQKIKEKWLSLFKEIT